LFCAEQSTGIDTFFGKRHSRRLFSGLWCPRGFIPFAAALSAVPFGYGVPVLDADSTEAKKEEALLRIDPNASDPVFYVLIQNPTTRSITALDITVTVQGAVGVGILNYYSGPLLPVQDYVIPVSPRPGLYRADPDVFAPALLIGPSQSLGINVRLRRKGNGAPVYGFKLVASIDVSWKGGRTSSVPFMVDFMDDGFGF
jgi:hypothetical protein